MAVDELPASVLLVDDNAANLLLLETLLKPLDLKLIRANSGAEALELIAREDFGTVVMDVQMPQLDGFETAALIRQGARNAEVPILFVTAIYREEAHVERGYALGAVDYLFKPIIPNALRAKVAALVDLWRRGETLRRREAALFELERARLSAEVARGAALIARLQSVTAAFSVALTSSQVTQIAVTQGCEAFDAPRGLVSLLSDRDSKLTVTSQSGYADADVEPWRHLPMAFSAPLTDAVRTRSAGFYETPAAVAASYPHLADGRVAGDQALAAIPLLVDGHALGALGLIFTEPRAFDASERTFMLTLGRLCAQALERSRLYEAEASARAAAEAANRAKDEWIMTVSHELRTPLSAILGWTQLLRGGQVPKEKQSRALETIERNARNQAKLIEDVLDASRMVSGRLQINVRSVALGEIVNAAIESIRPTAEARSIRLESQLSPELGVIQGDPDRLLQIANNLLANAVKFTPPGGWILVELRPVTASVELRVTDSGRGIEADFLPFVFDRFRQQEGGITRAHGGLGLGLSIVKRLIELHGGTISAFSEGAGRGASFVVRLPAPPGQASEAHASDLAEGDSQPAVSLRGLRVLVVDDEQDALEVVRSMLEEYEATVTVASSAREAYEALARGVPDALVSDLGMPGETGYDLIRKVRALPAERGGGVPSVALTAYARAEDRDKALASGFDAHVTKPVDLDAFVRVVERLCRDAPRR